MTEHPHAPLPAEKDPRLSAVYHADRVWNAVTTTRDGRCFVGFPSADGPGIRAAEVQPDGSLRPYPDAAWNDVREDHDPDGAFVNVNGLRTGPDDHLWIIDAGAPGIGARQIVGGARLIEVDLASDRIACVHDLGPATRELSYIDDIRFNGDLIYISDAGAPGLIVLDRRTGHSRRLLDGHPSTVDHRTMYADGQPLRDRHGDEVRVHVDQLEVSPDGRYLYFQPACGGLSRVETRWLDDPSVPAAAVAEHVEAWLDTPTTGGTAIDADGVIYLSDIDHRRILTIGPDRRIDTLVADPRLIWGDAMWIDSAGFLWIPATQQHLTPGLGGGRQAVRYPVWIYRMHVGATPPANDHR